MKYTRVFQAQTCFLRDLNSFSLKRFVIDIRIKITKFVRISQKNLCNTVLKVNDLAFGRLKCVWVGGTGGVAGMVFSVWRIRNLPF